MVAFCFSKLGKWWEMTRSNCHINYEWLLIPFQLNKNANTNRLIKLLTSLREVRREPRENDWIHYFVSGRIIPLGPVLRDESTNGNLADGVDELLESLVKTATKTPATRTTPRERKRTRHADRKSCKCDPSTLHPDSPLLSSSIDFRRGETGSLDWDDGPLSNQRGHVVVESFHQRRDFSR